MDTNKNYSEVSEEEEEEILDKKVEEEEEKEESEQYDSDEDIAEEDIVFKVYEKNQHLFTKTFLEEKVNKLKNRYEHFVENGQDSVQLYDEYIAIYEKLISNVEFLINIDEEIERLSPFSLEKAEADKFEEKKESKILYAVPAIAVAFAAYLAHSLLFM
jgi:hypothetical protein